MTNSKPPKRHPWIWWEAMMDRAKETDQPLLEVVREYRPMMNHIPQAMTMEQALTYSLYYPWPGEYIYQAFQVEES